MKSHLLTLTAAVLAIFAFSSCKKDPGYGDPAVKVNPGELNFKVDGGSETVNLTATVEWTVENSASWVKVEPMAGDLFANLLIDETSMVCTSGIYAS